MRSGEAQPASPSLPAFLQGLDGVEERFWSKVQRNADDQCWPWIASRWTAGYGKFGVRDRVYQAHRIAFSLSFGEIPKGLFVCHRCDNPACVNPSHLFLGSHLDNMADMTAKGRQMRGPTHRNLVLSLDDVLDMRRSYERREETQAQIAARFNVSLTTVSAVIRPKVHVPCDKLFKSGRRRGKTCRSRARFFDPGRRENLCYLHQRSVLGALPGIGTPWYLAPKYGCDTAGHEHRPLRRIVDDVRLCLECSGTYALAVELHADEVSA